MNAEDQSKPLNLDTSMQPDVSGPSGIEEEDEDDVFSAHHASSVVYRRSSENSEARRRSSEEEKTSGEEVQMKKLKTTLSGINEDDLSE